MNRYRYKVVRLCRGVKLNARQTGIEDFLENGYELHGEPFVFECDVYQAVAFVPQEMPIEEGVPEHYKDITTQDDLAEGKRRYYDPIKDEEHEVSDDPDVDYDDLAL